MLPQGYNITIGPGCYINFNCCFLDCAKITIGKNVGAQSNSLLLCTCELRVRSLPCTAVQWLHTPLHTLLYACTALLQVYDTESGMETLRAQSNILGLKLCARPDRPMTQLDYV